MHDASLLGPVMVVHVVAAIHLLPYRVTRGMCCLAYDTPSGLLRHAHRATHACCLQYAHLHRHHPVCPEPAGMERNESPEDHGVPGW